MSFLNYVRRAPNLSWAEPNLHGSAHPHGSTILLHSFGGDRRLVRMEVAQGKKKAIDGTLQGCETSNCCLNQTVNMDMMVQIGRKSVLCWEERGSLVLILLMNF